VEHVGTAESFGGFGADIFARTRRALGEDVVEEHGSESVVLSLTALIATGATFLIGVRKMATVGADARMRKGREQELRAKQ
jgi:hypothetical protein